jgi:hypothetical protein
METGSRTTSTPQNCTEVAFAEQVYLFYDGGLTPEEAAVFEKHLAFCDACQQTISDLDFINSALEEREQAPKVCIAGGNAN